MLFMYRNSKIHLWVVKVLVFKTFADEVRHVIGICILVDAVFYHHVVTGIYTLRNCVMRKILCGMTMRKEPDWLSAKTT